MANEEMGEYTNRYNMGERDGTRDAEQGWGMRDNEAEDFSYAQGYADGYLSTVL